VDWTNQAEHRSLLSLSAQLAAGFLRSGFAPLILVDTFSGDKIDGFLDAFRSESPLSRVLVAVLHASEGVLRERVRNRDADGFSNIDIALRINQEVVRDVRPLKMLLDSSDLAPADVAATILTLARALPVGTSRP
jgi:hypothetical protein